MNERIPTLLKWLIPIAVLVFLCIGALILFSGVSWLVGRATVERNPVGDLFEPEPAGQAASQDLFAQELGQLPADLVVVPDEDGQDNLFALTGKLLDGGANFMTIAGLQLYTDENTTRVGTIGNNSFVRVEGVVQPDGRLLATRVMPAEGLETYSGSLHGKVESLDGNTLVISGVNVRTNEQTSIDRSIEAGSSVVVDGFILPNGEWLALDVHEGDERQPANASAEAAGDNSNDLRAVGNPPEGSFTFAGNIQTIRPWRIAGRRVVTNDATQLTKGLAVGDLVLASGMIREDGRWVASSITRQEAEDGQATTMVIGRIDDTSPWTINGLRLEVNEDTEIEEGLEEGDLAIAGVVLTAGADGENRWLASSIQAFEAQLRDNCFAVLDTVVRLDNGTIVLRNWPAAILEEEIDLSGEVRRGSPVLATVCAQGEGRFTITRLVVLDLDDDRDEEDDDNENDNEDRDDDGDDNEDGNLVTICHYPPGNRDNAHTITVGEPAVEAHLRNHGDTLGPCP
jgi:hypothetical protein